MNTITIGEHIVEVDPNDVEYKGDEHNITIGLVNGNRYTLRLTYDNYVIDEEVLTFYIESHHGNQYAHLKHLYVPESLQGFGIGKMCLAIFHNLLKQNNINQFAMKFGGGSKSYSFLTSLGFDDRYIDTIQNMGPQGKSVVVGEFESFGSHQGQWKLDPISLSNFPTGFFR